MQEVKIGLLSRISKTHHPQPEWKMRVVSRNTIYSLKCNAYIYIYCSHSQLEGPSKVRINLHPVARFSKNHAEVLNIWAW